MATQADCERIGRFIYGFHRFASPDALRGLQAGEPLPAGLAGRGAALAERFDAVLADWEDSSASDERIDTLLKDTRDFAAELAYARIQGAAY